MSFSPIQGSFQGRILAGAMTFGCQQLTGSVCANMAGHIMLPLEVINCVVIDKKPIFAVTSAKTRLSINPQLHYRLDSTGNSGNG